MYLYFLVLVYLHLLGSTNAQYGIFNISQICVYDSSTDPVFRYSGGYDPQITPYQCLKNCMAQELHQRYDKEMVIGITQAAYCLCGYDYLLKAPTVIEILGTGAASILFCDKTCDDGTECGGDFGRISVYKDFVAATTIGLRVTLLNAALENVAIEHDKMIDPPPKPQPSAATTLATTAPATGSTTEATTTAAANGKRKKRQAGMDGIEATTRAAKRRKRNSNKDGGGTAGGNGGGTAGGGNGGSGGGTAGDQGTGSGGSGGSGDSSSSSTAAPTTTPARTGSTHKKLQVMEKMDLTIEFGEYKCSKNPAGDKGDETICAIKDAAGLQAMPPVWITIDFGDGSGQQLWSREDPLHLWIHQYSLPGNYFVSVSTLNEYDGTGDELWFEVEVIDPIYPMMGMEVVCPPVVQPGTFFLCTADIPRGSSAKFELVMTDDLKPDMDGMVTSSGLMDVPEQWLHIPGGPLKTQSYNTSYIDTMDQNYVIQSTYFQYMANLSAIEFVAATAGTFYVDVVFPICPKIKNADGLFVDSYWCPLTGACEEFCYSSLQMQPDWDTEWGSEWECSAKGQDWCSLEGMCSFPAKVACPMSSSGEFGQSPYKAFPYPSPKTWTDAETGENVTTSYDYEVNKTFKIEVKDTELFQKLVVKIEKEFYDDPERKQHRKTHNERSYFEWCFLAIRCVESPCAYLAREKEENERKVDIVTTFADPLHTVQMSSEQRRAIRPILFEDRILAIEQKFFCDRTTEKTVTLTVTDNANVPNTLKNATKKLSCQYPLMGVVDLTELNEANTQNNTWQVIKDKLSCVGATDGSCDEEYNATTGEKLPREYEAHLWARVDETIRFHINFTEGSHMIFSWLLDSDDGVHVDDMDEYCKTEDTVPSSGDLAVTDIEGMGATIDKDKNFCTFPFRYKDILYYACTYITNATLGGTEDAPIHLCATSVDDDYNPLIMGFCRTACPIQLQRPAESGLVNKSVAVHTEDEGETAFSQKFVKAQSTEIIIDRKFTKAGYTYTLRMTALNMHDITSTNMMMVWKILCANPVVPQNWFLDFPPYHYEGQIFNITFRSSPEVDLPTMPLISINPVVGIKGSKSTAMRRWDHAPFFSISDKFIQFYVRDDYSIEANKSKDVWAAKYRKPVSEAPHLLYEEYQFLYMGMENDDEEFGDPTDYTNLKSGPESGEIAAGPINGTKYGLIGFGEDATVRDYKTFTICLPYVKHPGSHGFTVNMWNGISNIRYSNYWNLSSPEYYSEPYSLLVPGGPGYTHETGKDDTGYCVGTYCDGGAAASELVLNSTFKWELNWVEIFAKLETPFEATLKYVLPEEAPEDKPNLDFVKPKYYLPAQAHPVFEILIYKGTPRRIRYTFTNANLTGSTFYQPPDCYIDWPPGNLMPPCNYKGCTSKAAKEYAVFEPKLYWDIEHCPNITEDTYWVSMAAWNPLDGWHEIEKPLRVEVLERIGPIKIDDLGIISDKNETKEYIISFGKMGAKTCITVEYGDDSKMEFFGNALSCKQRYQSVTEDRVTPVDYVSKTFSVFHTYETRGLYPVTVTGFDERSFAEETIDVTIFRMPCKVPAVWLPINQTSWLRWERIPMNIKSKSYQVAAMTILECNKTVETYMTWYAYTVSIVKDPASQTGKKEVLSEIQINETVAATYQSSLIDIPKLTFDYGLHKLVFKFELETGVPGLPLYRTAYTYFNVTKSPLVPVFIKGSVAMVTRGWEQTLKLEPGRFSADPDNPLEKDFNYTWWCRVKSPNEEVYDQYEIDEDEMEYPVMRSAGDLQRIPRVSDPIIIQPPPGCFGWGPGPIKVPGKGDKWFLNTASLVTYAQVYEIAVIISKDTRRAMTIIELDLGIIPTPIVEIDCASEGLCFPTFGGIFVNPTSRLALRGICVEECETGGETYQWKIQDPGVMMNTLTCDPDLTTTTTEAPKPSTTTTITTTTTLAPATSINSLSLVDNTTNTSVIASEAATGSETTIMVTVQETSTGASRRRKRDVKNTSLETRVKRQASGGSLSMGQANEKAVVDTSNQKMIPDHINKGCSSVFTGGTSQKEFSMTTDFFKQNSEIETFNLMLNITNCVNNGRKITCASGISMLKIMINKPPCCGTCTVKNLYEGEPGDPPYPYFGKQTGVALLDEFELQCNRPERWKDPDGHAMVKYVFKITEQTPRGNETRLLYAGPLDKTTAVFGVGKFHLFAEIHEEAGAFAVYDIDTSFTTFLPSQERYDTYNLQKDLTYYQGTGNSDRIAQLLQADASIRQKASWYSLDDLAGDKGRINMTLRESNKYDDLLRNLTHSNTALIRRAVDTLQFNSVEQLDQGANTLYSLTSQLVKNGDISKTLDMQGRDGAVELIENMAEGFNNIQVSDPNKIKNFIEGTTGAVVAILNSLNAILMSNDPSQIPLTDFEMAASLPYDTDIPEDNADIPDSADEALRENAMKLTRINAVSQVKKMVALIDDIAATALRSSVIGEVLTTKAPLGVSMKMAKVAGSHTIGQDRDGDGYPDIPLIYDFKDSDTRIEFPLNFCPGELFEWEDEVNGTKTRHKQWNISPDVKKFPCRGIWGIAIKEWEAIKQAYPTSSRNLNMLTKSVDVDIYDQDSNLVDIKTMLKPIKITVPRMKEKDKILGLLVMPEPLNVDPKIRLKTLEKRKRPPILFHKVTSNRTYATINIQIKPSNPAPNSNLAIIAKFARMTVCNPTCDCDFIQEINKVRARDGEWIDWFIDVGMVQNRTGDWFFGVVSLDASADTFNQSCANIKKSDFLWKAEGDPELKDGDTLSFNTTYQMRTYTGGCYYFNSTTETWEAIGVVVEEGGNNIVTRCQVDHLTSFGSGFFPEVNTIDFEYVFADTDFKDNMTIYMTLLITIIFFLITFIWAALKDKKDVDALKPHWMKDNQINDHYFYEIIVQTGPMLSHGTTSKVQFILTGEDEETDVRTLSDPTKNFFSKGNLDTFLMSVEKPLGHLHFIRVWHDNSGIREQQPWYLMSILVHDLQTGHKFRFLADRWLAIDRAEFTSDIKLPVSTVDGMADKGYLMKQGIFSKLKDDHIWWSVFSRPKRSRFTRTQRTAVCMAAMYLAMITNAMWYGNTPQRLGDNLAELFFLEFTFEEISTGLISSLIILPPLILMVMLFRKAKAGSKKESRIDKTMKEAIENGLVIVPEKSYKRTLKEGENEEGWPPYCLYIGWVLVILFILGGMGIVAMYGLQFGNEKTRAWLCSMIISFFWNVFVEQPIKVAIIAVVIAMCKRRPKWDQDHVDVDEDLPTIYFDPDDPKLAKASRPKTQAPEFDPNYFNPLQDRRIMEQEMNHTLMEILTYWVYLIMVLMIANGNRDPNSFYMKDMLATTAVHGGLLCGRPEGEPCDPDEDGFPKWKNMEGGWEPNPYVDFMKVIDVNQFWLWTNKTLLPTVRVQNWYNDKPPYGLRGYLDDRVNRLIGYAVIRQVREAMGTCTTPPLMRDYMVEGCTGNLMTSLFEDDRDYCVGWRPLISENCTRGREFEFKSASERGAVNFMAGYRTYSGGGYELKMKGYIGDLFDKINMLKEVGWIDNRTRAVITEFSVYNAQVNFFGIVRICAEFIGGGISPYYRIDVIRLFKAWTMFDYITQICEVIFVFSVFYYIISLLATLKKEGTKEFFDNTWNIVDIFTVVLSLVTLALYGVKTLAVMEMNREIKRTRGNEYISLDKAQVINMYYDYTVSVTVFTSILKFCKLLSFQKAFKQIAATIKLCFIGLSTFVVEFCITFGSFCCFFYFILSADLKNFLDFVHTVENTLSMAIGKFNFASLKEANVMAAWIFFAFSIVVNMILINMMMAIINLAFEEIKEQKDTYKNKFDIMTYIKKSTKELVGTDPAQRDLPVYKKDGDEEEEEDGEEEENDENKISDEFSNKTNQLLEYIEKTYLKGFVANDGQGKSIVDKMRKAGNPDQAVALEYGFDSLFGGGDGPTPTASALGMRSDPDEGVDTLATDPSIDGMSMNSNVDGMNI